MSTVAQAVEHQPLLARFVYPQPVVPRAEELPRYPFFRYPEESLLGHQEPAPRPSRPFAPRDVERVFADLDRLFDLAAEMADLERTRGFDPWQVTQPVAVERIRLGSPLEVILALAGTYATPTVLRCALDLIAEAWNIKARIRRDRATLEAETLAADVEAETSRRELARLAADQLVAPRSEPPALTAPASVDFWLGDADDAPELEFD